MVFRTVENQTQSLAMYMPSGRLFEAKTVQDSNFRQLLRGLSGELFTAQGYLTTLEQEYLPDQTTLFLNEWEQALGIPDACFSGEGTIIERRRDIIVKLSSLGVQTANDFEALALVYGVVVEVTALSEEALPPYPVPFNPVSFPEARYTIIVSGDDIAGNVPPYAVPFDLDVGETILQCLFEKLAPENCKVIFRNNN